MQKIDLDFSTLLGFKIVRDNRSASALQSAKIGGKVCIVREESVGGAKPSLLAAGIGNKAD